MPVDSQRVPDPARAGRLRSGARKTLVYFGLAEDSSSVPGPETARREFFTTVLMTTMFSGAVGDHRGTTVGWCSAALFVPLLLAAAAAWWSRPEGRTSLPDRLAIPPIMIGAALWIVPRHVDLWVPLAIGIGISTSILTVGWATNRDRPDRRPRG